MPIGASGAGASVTLAATHPTSVAFSPDGSRLALYVDTETPVADPEMNPARKSRPCVRSACVWDVGPDGSLSNKKTVVLDRAPVLRARSSLSNLAVTNDGKTLYIDDDAPIGDGPGASSQYSVGPLSGILQYDVTTGKLAHALTSGANGGVLTLGPQCGVVAVNTERQFTIWSVAAGSEPAELDTEAGWFHGFAGTDSAIFVTQAAGGLLTVTDRTTRHASQVGGQAAPISQSAVFSPDGGLLALGGEETVLLLDLRFGGSKSIRIPDGHVRKIAFSPDSRRMVVGGSGTGLYSTETGVLIHSYGFPSDKLAFSPDGLLFAAGSGPRIRRLLSPDRSGRPDDSDKVRKLPISRMESDAVPDRGLAGRKEASRSSTR